MLCCLTDDSVTLLRHHTCILTYTWLSVPAVRRTHSEQKGQCLIALGGSSKCHPHPQSSWHNTEQGQACSKLPGLQGYQQHQEAEARCDHQDCDEAIQHTNPVPQQRPAANKVSGE
jgi:hypothetical protein